MKIYLQALSQILKITYTILLFAIIPAVLFTLLTSKTEVLGISSFVVLSGSMEPSVPLGSIIYTKPLEEYNPGEVIAFKQGNTTVSHRIVSIKNQNGEILYQTKGDANKGADQNLVSKTQVLGKKAFLVLNAGKLILFLKTLPGFALFIILPTLIFIGFEFWNIKKEFEKEIRKKVLNQLSLYE